MKVPFLWNPLSEQINYLAEGLNPEFMENTIDESVVPLARLSFSRANSAPKHSLSLVTTSLMFGLAVDISDIQSLANSTAFHAELISKSPRNLGSTILLISPVESMELTH